MGPSLLSMPSLWLALYYAGFFPWLFDPSDLKFADDRLYPTILEEDRSPFDSTQDSDSTTPQDPAPPPPLPQPDETGNLGRMVTELAGRGWDLAKNFVRDGLYLAAAPLRIHDESVWPVVAAFGLVAGSAAFDEPLQRWSQDRRTPRTERFWERVEAFHNSMAFEAAAFGLGLLSGESWVVEMSLTALEARVFSAALVEGIKTVAGRRRPHEARGAFEFGAGGRSFPSGHVVNVAPTVFVFSRYFDSWVFDAIGATAIALKSYQRIHGNHHWLSDTVASVLIAWGVANALVDLRRDPGLRILPYVDIQEDGEPALGLSIEVGR